MIRKGNALIEFHHKVDPGTLTVEEWAKRYNDILWCLKFNKEMIWGKGKKDK